MHLKAEPCAGLPHVFQIERRDHVRVSIDRRLDHQFIIGMGAGWPPVVIEHNRDTEPGQRIQYLRDVCLARPRPRKMYRPPEHGFVLHQQRC